MIDYTHCSIELVSVHHIGNKNYEDEIKVSQAPLQIDDPVLKELLLKYFFTHFNAEELFCFTFSDDKLELNPVYNLTAHMLAEPENFHEHSISLAKYLYDCSVHPNIKPGDLYIAYFKNVYLHNEPLDVVGLFKSEVKNHFLKLISERNDFSLQHEEGINIEKLDKGCLVFKKDFETGFRLALVDKSNKSGDAQFWKETFLNVKPLSDSFQHTKSMLNLAKEFVVNHLTTEFEVTKADQIDYLNKSVDYFKVNERFQEEAFLNEVFEDQNVIQSFSKFKEEYNSYNEQPIEDDFMINSAAVKRQSKIFKRVIKLDRNFHIYIHGDKDMIERGYDAAVGKHYYKVYFDEEQ